MTLSGKGNEEGELVYLQQYKDGGDNQNRSEDNSNKELIIDGKTEKEIIGDEVCDILQEAEEQIGKLMKQ